MLLAVKKHIAIPFTISKLHDGKPTHFMFNPTCEVPDPIAKSLLETHPQVYFQVEKGKEVDPKAYKVKIESVRKSLLEDYEKLSPEVQAKIRAFMDKELQIAEKKNAGSAPPAPPKVD